MNKRTTTSWWTPGRVRLLGRDTDIQIAKQLGVQFWQVRRKRQQLGIPGYRHFRIKKRWTRREQSLLGTNTDAQIAKRLGLEEYQVRRKRRRSGIAAFHKARPWTAREVRLLGTDSDAAVAKRLGRDVNYLKTKRIKLGIRAFHPYKPWTRADIKLLGTMSDRALSKIIKRRMGAIATKRHKLGIRGFVQPRRWAKWELALLGKVSDLEAARRIGVHVCRVALKRRKLGIPALLKRIRTGSITIHWKRLREIPGFPGYFASKTGIIYSMRRGTLHKLTPTLMQPQHHLIVALENARGVTRKCSVQRAVLMAWKGLSKNKHRIWAMHKDGNPFNNHLSNIAWASPTEVIHAKMDRGYGRGQTHPNAKLTDAKVLQIRRLAAHLPHAQIAKRFGISQSYVAKIHLRQSWAHL